MKTASEQFTGSLIRKSKVKRFLKIIIPIMMIFALFGAYQTLPAPTVIYQDTAEPVKQSLDVPFIIRFSQAMNQQSVENAFKIQPSLKGEFEWRDKKTLVFKSQDPLKIDDEYRLYIGQNARNWYGKKIEQTVRFHFLVTGPPAVIFASHRLPFENEPSSSGLSVMNGNESLTVMFDRAMNWESVPKEQLLILDPPLKGEIAFIGNSAFQFKPQAWPVDKVFSATVPAGIQDTGGGKMTKDFEWQFRTPLLQIVSTNLDAPLGPNDPVVVHFNREVDLNQVRPGENVLLFPTNDLEKTGLKDNGFFNTEVIYDQNEEGYINKQTLIFKPTFPFQVNQEHRFAIKEGFEGLEIPFESAFYVQEEDQNDSLTDEETASSSVFAWKQTETWPLFIDTHPVTFNFEADQAIANFNLYLCPIDQEIFIKLQKNPDQPPYVCEQNPVEFSPSAEKRTLVLNELFKGVNEPGIYILSAVINSGEETLRFNQGFFVSDTMLLMKQSTQGAFIWSIDAATMEPVSRMELAFSDQEGKAIASGVTDGKGVYKITKPLPKELYVAATKSIEGENRFAFMTPTLFNAPFVDQGSAVYLTASSNILTNERKVFIKGVWRFYEQSLLQLPSHPFIDLALEDEWGTQYAFIQVPVKNNGSFDLSWELPPDLTPGTYHVAAFLNQERLQTNPFSLQIKSPDSDLFIDWMDAEPLYLISRMPVLTLKGFYSGYMPASQLQGVWTLYSLKEEGPVLIESQNFVLDEDGKIQVPLEGILEEGGAYKITAALQNTHLQTITAEHSFKLQMANHDTVLEPLHRFLSAGDPLSVGIIHQTASGETVSAINTSFFLIRQQNLRKVWSDQRVAGDQESQFFDFKIPDGLPAGRYLLTAESRDEQGHLVRAEETIYLLEEKLSEPLYPHVRMVADRDEFLLGETARLLINVPQASFEQPVTALITYERGHVFASDVLTLDSPVTVLEAPVRSVMSPFVHAKLYLPKKQAGVLDGRIVFEETDLKIKIKNPADELLVEFTTQPAVPLPGEEVTFFFKVKNAQNLPAPSVLSLNLKSEHETLVSLEDYFWAQLKAVFTFSNDHLTGSSPTPDALIPAQRWNSAGFEPFLETDLNGEASMTMTLPKEDGPWYLEVLAASERKAFVHDSFKLLKEPDFELTPHLPQVVTLGDTVELAVEIKNHSNQSFTSVMELWSPYFETEGSFKQTIALEPKNSAFLTWKGRVTGFDESGHLPLRFIWGDQEKQEKVMVKSHRQFKTLYKGAPDAQQHQGAFIAPSPAFAGVGGVHLAFGPSVASLMAESVFISSQFSYHPLDQLIRQILIELSLSTQAEIQKSLKAKLQQLSLNLTPGSGFDLWESSATNVRLNGYGLLALYLAKQQGYQVSEGQLNDLKDTLWRGISGSEFSRHDTLFNLWVLSKTGVYDTAFVLKLFQQREDFSPQEKAFLLMTLHQLKEAGQTTVSSFIDSLLSEIVSLGVEEKGYMFFKGDQKDTLKTTAIMLYAFYQVDPQNILISKIEHFLGSDMSSWELPADPEEALWVSFALAEATLHKEGEPQSPVTLSLNQIPFETSTFVPASDLLLDQQNQWQIQADDAAYLSAQWFYATPTPEIEAVEKSALIIRRYWDLNSGEEAATLRAGDWYEGELLFILPEEGQNILIESPLSTGLKGLYFSSHLAEASESGTEGWMFEEANIKEGKVTLYASSLPAGVYSIRYMVQAGFAGEFQHLPATLQTMYQRDTYARTEGGVIKILP